MLRYAALKYTTKKDSFIKAITVLLLVIFWAGQLGSTVTAAALSEAQKQALDSGVHYFNVGSGCTGGASTTNLTGSDNQEKIFNYFIGRGLTAIQAAAIDGNFGQESTWNPSDPGGYLAQWGGVRLTALGAFAQQQGQPVTDLGVQLDYVWLELTNGPGAGEDRSNVLTALKATTDIITATTVFMGTLSAGGSIDGYENPGNPQLQNRITFAQQIYQQYGGSAAASGASGSSTGCQLSSVDCSGSTSNSAVDTTGLSQVRQSVICIAQQELDLWKSQPGYPTPAYSQTGYLKYSQNRTEEWCADFVSWVYDQAKYPLQPDPNWDVSYVPNIQSIGQSGTNFHWHPQSSGYTPKPGDIAIHGANHTNIFISSSGSAAQYIGGDQGSGPYPGGSIVSVENGNGYYDNGITGYVSPD